MQFTKTTQTSEKNHTHSEISTNYFHLVKKLGQRVICWIFFYMSVNNIWIWMLCKIDLWQFLLRRLFSLSHREVFEIFSKLTFPRTLYSSHMLDWLSRWLSRLNRHWANHIPLAQALKYDRLVHRLLSQRSDVRFSSYGKIPPGLWNSKVRHFTNFSNLCVHTILLELDRKNMSAVGTDGFGKTKN